MAIVGIFGQNNYLTPNVTHAYGNVTVSYYMIARMQGTWHAYEFHIIEAHHNIVRTWLMNVEWNGE